jgi:hypothetical protein
MKHPKENCFTCTLYAHWQKQQALQKPIIDVEFEEIKDGPERGRTDGGSVAADSGAATGHVDSITGDGSETGTSEGKGEGGKVDIRV